MNDTSCSKPISTKAISIPVAMKRRVFFSKWAVLALIGWCVFASAAFSDAGVDLISFMLAFYILVIWSVVWIVRLAIWWIRKRRAATANTTIRWPWFYWSLEPAVLLMSTLLAVGGVYRQARFWLSESQLRAYAEQVRTGHVQPSTRARRVGLYQVRETELVDKAAVRMITSPDGFNDAGFVYVPEGTPPPSIGEDIYVHLRGPWWHWVRSW